MVLPRPKEWNRGRRRKYDFHTMQVGETRVIEAKQLHAPVVVIRSAVSKIARREGMKFTTHVRPEDGAFLVFRQK